MIFSYKLLNSDDRLLPMDFILVNMMQFNRKYSKHTSLEIMNYKICDYFVQRRDISNRKVNAKMFSWKIIIVGHLNRPVHLC